ncbi:hypothetical protein LTR66_006812 [Elasticomyces elasticus]|nr:hypothetical protein LTR50_007741 [Elasticomyces elasticus]KAK4990417.1 hypothetical protein LTR66_006812 [Elasticomyces elasticus]
MHYTTILASSLSLLSLASARIAGIQAPATLAPGSSYDITIITGRSYQPVSDISMAFGLVDPASQAHLNTLGTFLDAKTIGRENSNVGYNLSQQVTIPSSAAEGDAVLTASLFSLHGPLSTPMFTNFHLNVTITKQTTGVLASTFDSVDSCASV